MQTQVAKRTDDQRTSGENEIDHDEIDNLAELREARTEDVADGNAELIGRAEASLEQRNVDEAEQREVELREEDDDSHPDTRQSVQRR